MSNNNLYTLIKKCIEFNLYDKKFSGHKYYFSDYVVVIKKKQKKLDLLKVGYNCYGKKVFYYVLEGIEKDNNYNPCTHLIFENLIKIYNDKKFFDNNLKVSNVNRKVNI